MSLQIQCEFLEAAIRDLYAEHGSPPVWKIYEVLKGVSAIPDHSTRDVLFLTAKLAVAPHLRDLVHAESKRSNRAHGVGNSPDEEIFQIATALIRAIQKAGAIEPPK